MDPATILAIMSNPSIREVFKAVARHKYVRRRDLRDQVQSATDPQELNLVLNELTNASLIRAEKAPLADFDTYYVTAEGLSAERALNRFEEHLKSSR
jgi:hypothetical protein